MATEIASGDLAELVRYQASTRPETVAMAFRGRETTYRKLDDCASQVANGLLAINTAPQMRVAVFARNSAVFYEVLFGAAKARDVLLAVNWRLAASEITYILNDAEAEVLFVGVASASAIARPIPREDPVTIATLPRKLKSGMSQARSYAVPRFDPTLTPSKWWGGYAVSIAPDNRSASSRRRYFWIFPLPVIGN